MPETTRDRCITPGFSPSTHHRRKLMDGEAGTRTDVAGKLFSVLPNHAASTGTDNGHSAACNRPGVAQAWPSGRGSCEGRPPVGSSLALRSLVLFACQACGDIRTIGNRRTAVLRRPVPVPARGADLPLYGGVPLCHRPGLHLGHED